MCFSAPASFIASAVTGAAGLGAVVRAREKAEVPFAAIPLFFAFQQALEGLLWLNLPVAPDSRATSALTHGFLFFALVFWPLFAPWAAFLIEPDPRRRGLIRLCLALGAGVSCFLLWTIVQGTHTAAIAAGHIAYILDPYPPMGVGLAYLAATAGGTLLSSQSTVRLFGAIVLAGSLIAYFAYWEVFLSVWCFFAAAASAVILAHFEKVRRARGTAAV